MGSPKGTPNFGVYPNMSKNKLPRWPDATAEWFKEKFVTGGGFCSNYRLLLTYTVNHIPYTIALRCTYYTYLDMKSPKTEV